VRHDALVQVDVAPSRDDPTVAGCSRLIGGPWGRHASGRTSMWWTPLRIALGLTVLVTVFGYLQKSPCLSHPYTNEYQYTRACYTDTYALYSDEGLGARLGPDGQVVGRLSVPYRDHPVEYPPVIGGLMWAAAEVTNAVHPDAQPGSALDDRGRTFFDLTALGLAAAALISTWTVARLAGRRRGWDAAMVALSPVLLMHAFTNWDLVAVALTGLGLWAWSRGSPGWAGALLGLGIATKLYPVLVLLALVMLCLRARALRAAAAAILAAAGTVVAAYVPAIVLSHLTSASARTSTFLFPSASCPQAHPLSGWRWFTSLSQIRGADWGSVWLILQHVMGRPLDPAVGCGQAPVVLNTVAAVAVLLAVAAVGYLVAVAPRRPRVGQVAFLLVAVFVLLNKVDSPQYALWLVPLAVLARPRWGWLLGWQVSEVVLGVANLYVLVATDHPDQGMPIGAYLLLIVVRDVVLAALLALVVREALDPGRDVVRRGGVDDPAGGVLDQAPDRHLFAPASLSPTNAQ
jgi:uncharacterized membrane protein